MLYSGCCFFGAESMLLAGSIINSYHTTTEGIEGFHDPFCSSLKSGIFFTAAILILLAMVASILYYCASDYGKATADNEPPPNPSLEMTGRQGGAMEDGGEGESDHMLVD
ncbi:hypothetical protein V6N11_043570 [Hibiscus sabdariffa]|uniref:Uncharacterized protein n=1 Tax=Hibiscus sabdariffa TaxID=183260 RepID=A0ABR2RCX5_9ROSI